MPESKIMRSKVGELVLEEKKTRRRKKKRRNDDNDDKEEEEESYGGDSKHNRNNNQRLRKKQKRTSQQGEDRSSLSSLFLSGMTISISTLHQYQEQQEEEPLQQQDPHESNNNNKKKDDAEHSSSYGRVATIARQYGAEVSSQVHKRVECLLCTKAAITKLTQRVRKATKKRIPLVDIDWLHKSIERQQKLPLDSFLLKYPTATVVMTTSSSKTMASTSTTTNGKDNDDEDHHHQQQQQLEDCDGNDDDMIIPDNSDAGWTAPVDVGCCCVCHENGTTADCEWCIDCKF